MNTLLALLAVAALALCAWAVAEWKYKFVPFHEDDAEKAAQEQALKTARDADFTEKGIKDIMETISTKGFDATK